MALDSGRKPSLLAAGRELFAASRLPRKSTNDADRLNKYLARFDLSWATSPDGPEAVYPLQVEGIAKADASLTIHARSSIFDTSSCQFEQIDLD